MTEELTEEQQKRLSNWIKNQHGSAGWEQKLENFIAQELATAKAEGAREEWERIIELITNIKNMSSDESPKSWFDALYCVRNSIKQLTTLLESEMK